MSLHAEHHYFVGNGGILEETNVWNGERETFLMDFVTFSEFNKLSNTCKIEIFN